MAVAHIEAYLGQHPEGGLCIIEDAAAKKSDEAKYAEVHENLRALRPEQPVYHKLYLGEFPYLILKSPFPGEYQTNLFLGDGSYFDVNVVVCLCWEGFSAYLNGECAFDEALDEIARRADSMFVEAFDFRGYIFWERLGTSVTHASPN